MRNPDYQLLYMMAIAQIYGVKGTVNAALEMPPEYRAKALENIREMVLESIDLLEGKEKQHESI